jgi:8-oxo-dGTP pyrophosphatase MutT (NUDIX family)
LPVALPPDTDFLVAIDDSARGEHFPGLGPVCAGYVSALFRVLLILGDFTHGFALWRSLLVPSFVAWRDWGYPDASVRHCFSLGALRARDGGFLLGVMNSHTLNAGKIYFPTGVPDPRDIVGGVVDLTGSVAREMAEETGLAINAHGVEEGWYSVLTNPHIAHFKVLHAAESAVALRARIRAHLAQEPQPEFADVRIVRGPTDLDPMMPITVRTFLTYMWSQVSESRP